MSNPTKLVSNFDGSLAYTDQSGPGNWTGVDPIRYDGGLLVEEADGNRVYNPVAAVGTIAWFFGSNVTGVQEASLPGPLPGYLASLVTTGLKLTTTAIKTADTSLVIGTSNPSAAGVHAIQGYVWVPSSVTATGLAVTAGNFVGATGLVDGAIDMSKRDQWQRCIGSITVDAGDINGHTGIFLRSGSMQSGESIWFTLIGLSPGSYATSPVAETLGAGYANTGAAHNSPSTRAASSASVATANHIDPSSGAIAMRIAPTIETGVEEIWGECGVKGSGTDHVRWGRDASKHPFVEWSANNASYQRLTGSETLNALTAYDLYLGHSATTISLAVDAGTLQTGTRAAVSGDFSTGDLTLEASAGGVIYQPFATFDRTLTAKEIATLNGKNNWTMKVLAGNPYINFQLRPY